MKTAGGGVPSTSSGSPSAACRPSPASCRPPPGMGAADRARHRAGRARRQAAAALLGFLPPRPRSSRAPLTPHNPSCNFRVPPLTFPRPRELHDSVRFLLLAAACFAVLLRCFGVCVCVCGVRWCGCGCGRAIFTSLANMIV